MGDRSYMQISIYDCPTKQRQVGELLAGYVSLDGEDPRQVAVGEQYTVEEISLGSLKELAGSLTELAPRCSFTGWQDPFGQDLGDRVAYCPRWGRFDGECTGSGDVVLDHEQISANRGRDDEPCHSGRHPGPMTSTRPWIPRSTESRTPDARETGASPRTNPVHVAVARRDSVVLDVVGDVLRVSRVKPG
jgi:hypothetical protein